MKTITLQFDTAYSRDAVLNSLRENLFSHDSGLLKQKYSEPEYKDHQFGDVVLKNAFIRGYSSDTENRIDLPITFSTRYLVTICYDTADE